MPAPFRSRQGCDPVTLTARFGRRRNPLPSNAEAPRHPNRATTGSVGLNVQVVCPGGSIVLCPADDPPPAPGPGANHGHSRWPATTTANGFRAGNGSRCMATDPWASLDFEVECRARGWGPSTLVRNRLPRVKRTGRRGGGQGGVCPRSTFLRPHHCAGDYTELVLYSIFEGGCEAVTLRDTVSVRRCTETNFMAHSKSQALFQGTQCPPTVAHDRCDAEVEQWRHPSWGHGGWKAGKRICISARVRLRACRVM